MTSEQLDSVGPRTPSAAARGSTATSAREFQLSRGRPNGTEASESRLEVGPMSNMPTWTGKLPVQVDFSPANQTELELELSNRIVSLYQSAVSNHSRKKLADLRFNSFANRTINLPGKQLDRRSDSALICPAQIHARQRKQQLGLRSQIKGRTSAR